MLIILGICETLFFANVRCTIQTNQRMARFRCLSHVAVLSSKIPR